MSKVVFTFSASYAPTQPANHQVEARCPFFLFVFQVSFTYTTVTHQLNHHLGECVFIFLPSIFTSQMSIWNSQTPTYSPWDACIYLPYIVHLPSKSSDKKSLAKYTRQPMDDMGVSDNGDTPKWMVYNGKPCYNGWFIMGYHDFRKHPYGKISPRCENSPGDLASWIQDPQPLIESIFDTIESVGAPGRVKLYE